MEFSSQTLYRKRVQVVDDWALGKLIGEGSFGQVRMAKNIITGQKAVAKIIKRPKLRDDSMPTEAAIQELYSEELRLMQEAAILSRLSHPNIIGLHHSALIGDFFYCIFEYAEGEDLIDYLIRKGPLAEAEAKDIFQQVLSAVEYAHRNHVVHRDIKLENIRYDEVTNTIKVIDFGMATFCHEEFRLGTFCGSPGYIAPEIFQKKPYLGPAVDTWALGVCLYAMLTGDMPFEDDMATKPRFPKYLSRNVVHLLKRMLRVNAKGRIKLSVVMQHRWLKSALKGSVFSCPIFSEPFARSIMGVATLDEAAAMLSSLLVQEKNISIYASATEESLELVPDSRLPRNSEERMKSKSSSWKMAKFFSLRK